MALSIDEYLKHILDEAEFLSDQVASLDFDSFFNDESAKRAFVRSIEIIGEAVKTYTVRSPVTIFGGQMAIDSRNA